MSAPSRRAARLQPGLQRDRGVARQCESADGRHAARHSCRALEPALLPWARVTEGHSAKAPATCRRVCCEGCFSLRLPELGTCRRWNSRCAPVLTWIASVSSPKSSTADAGAVCSASPRSQSGHMLCPCIRRMHGTCCASSGHARRVGVRCNAKLMSYFRHALI